MRLTYILWEVLLGSIRMPDCYPEIGKDVCFPSPFHLTIHSYIIILYSFCSYLAVQLTQRW